MKKFLLLLGVIEEKSQLVTLAHSRKRDTLPASEIPAFTKWCNDLNVSLLANKNNEFTVLIGNNEKLVTLDRF